MGRHVTTPDPLRTPCDERPPPMSSANDGRLLHGHGGFYGFTALLASAMAVAIFSNAGLGILARFLIDDLGLTRTEIGWLSTAASLTGALLSPAAGKYADRVGGRRTIIAVFAVSAAGYVALGVAPTLGLLFVGALVSGIGQSGGNPSTNKLIGLHIPPGRRGFATGIKQSGVQVAIFLGGIILPTVALAWGWRVALILPGLVALVGLLFAVRFVPNDPPIPPRIRGRAGTKTPIPSGIKWMATDAALNGMIVASLVTYLPLYAEESAGMGIEAAGLVTSVFAFSGFISRIGWAHFAEKDPPLFPAIAAYLIHIDRRSRAALDGAIIWPLAGICRRLRRCNRSRIQRGRLPSGHWQRRPTQRRAGDRPCRVGLRCWACRRPTALRVHGGQHRRLPTRISAAGGDRGRGCRLDDRVGATRSG